MKGKGRGGSGGSGRGGGRKPDWIAAQLRRVYDDALGEEIPAEMLALLEELERKREEEDKS